MGASIPQTMYVRRDQREKKRKPIPRQSGSEIHPGGNILVSISGKETTIFVSYV
ncbi:MAG: hypothetical protein J5959_08915 [Butyrivibrio sp.]|nr:hypothetical protein [Butyrivibrio sp.]